MRLTLNSFDRAPVDWRCFGCGRYVLVQWHLDAKAAFRWAKHGVLGTALALVAAERNLAVELHGSPCSPRTFGVVEVRGVEPLTFSMPSRNKAKTTEDRARQSRILADCLICSYSMNPTSRTVCTMFVLNTRRHPPPGNRFTLAPAFWQATRRSCPRPRFSSSRPADCRQGDE